MGNCHIAVNAGYLKNLISFIIVRR